MPDSIDTAVAGKARRYADQCEDAGDFVGANDTALANHLYSAAQALRLYASNVEGRSIDGVR